MIRTGISSYIYIKQWDVIIHSCLNCATFKLRHGCLINSTENTCVIIHSCLNCATFKLRHGCLINSTENTWYEYYPCLNLSLRWRHNERDSVSNHQPHDCLLNRLFRRRSKKTSKLRVTGLCVENSPGTGEFPAQMVSYAENVSIWWRHHVVKEGGR